MVHKGLSITVLDIMSGLHKKQAFTSAATSNFVNKTLNQGFHYKSCIFVFKNKIKPVIR